MRFKEIEHPFEITGFYSAFRFAWDKLYKFHGESHDLWEIVLVTSGVVEATEDEKVYMLEKNNMLLHAPMEFHRIGSAEGTCPTGMIMTFGTRGTLPAELKKGIFNLSEHDREEYETICDAIGRFLTDEADNPYAGQKIAAELTAFLIRLGAEKAERRLDNSPAAIEYRRVVSAMTAGVCDNLTLSDFALSCNISVSYIKQLFKKYAGLSPKAYYTHLRVQQAAKLLDEGLAASEIADRMNFSSPNYFSVFFKKHTGTIPSEYKKK
ncbi:MAG: helix-turn-helix transcriptional regulator [Clostridia bacterium]|nr:helix-turn-helix transcriptional regulator [Clostridia bacterium]